MSRRYGAQQSYQQFLSKLKSKQKKQKQERKENLRQIRCRKLVESSENSNEQQFFKKTYKKGNKWWHKINRYYFQQITEQYFQNMKQLTTSSDILNFGGELPSLLPYYQEIICEKEPEIFRDDTIRVLWKNQHEQILVGYVCEEGPQIQQETVGEKKQEKNDEMPLLWSFHTMLDSNSNPVVVSDQSMGQCNLNYLQSTNNREMIMKCLEYEKIFRNEEKSQIQNQIQCWQKQLEYQHEIISSLWDNVQENLYREMCLNPHIDFNDRIREIKRALSRSENFDYFRNGYADKTVDEYEIALGYFKQDEGKKGQSKLIFQTDCKICFCTKNQPTNVVIYCDSCNTSFHQHCYGIETIKQDQEVLCDVCLEKQTMSHEAISCQICGRDKFPLKKLNGHYYHVACLILFNFAEINDFKLTLQKDVNHEVIMRKVIEAELKNQGCAYCCKLNKLGMKLQCKIDGCSKSYHPICAYLNGCVFNIYRNNNGGIQVQVSCREHLGTGMNEIISQIFLRRFMCNYNNTSNFKEDQFKIIYKKQLEKLAAYRENVVHNQKNMIENIINTDNVKLDFNRFAHVSIKNKQIKEEKKKIRTPNQQNRKQQNSQ